MHMHIVIILAMVAAAGLVVFSLARGLIYFSRSANAAGENGGPSEMHLAQNRMMFARIKWQAVTVLLLIVLGFLASGGN